MASVALTNEAGASFLHTWLLTTADPTGDSITFPGASDRTVQFVATTAGSATIVLEGSMDDVTYFTLTDGQERTELGVDDFFPGQGGLHLLHD